jgi:hypothetical protein
MGCGRILFSLHKPHCDVGLQLLNVNLVIGKIKLLRNPLNQVTQVLLVWKLLVSSDLAGRGKRFVCRWQRENVLLPIVAVTVKYLVAILLDSLWPSLGSRLRQHIVRRTYLLILF